MKNKIMQLTHRYPVLEYVLNIVSFFLVSLMLVILLVLFSGLLYGA